MRRGRNDLAQNALVPEELHVRQSDVELDFLLRRQVGLHVALQPTKQKRTQNLLVRVSQSYRVEAVNQIRLHRLLEVGVKQVRALKHVRHQEVQQRPQFVEIVLQRRSRDQQSVFGGELTNRRAECARLVLDAMSLVDNHVLPIDRRQRRSLAENDLVARDAHVKASLPDLVVQHFGTVRAISLENHDAQRRTPLAELSKPVGHGGFGRNDDVGTYVKRTTQSPPLIARHSFRYPRREIVWRVLPRPISSARMPLIPVL